MRLIDADAYSMDMKVRYDNALKWEADAKRRCDYGDYAIVTVAISIFDEAKLTLDKQPTVDAVPVAFCDKCKHWDRDWKPNHSGENEHYCPMIDLVTDADFFCKYGERKGWDE